MASDNAVYVSNSSKCYVKPNLNLVSGVDASHTDVKPVIGSDAYVKQILPGNVLHANVNPACVNADWLYCNGGSALLADQKAVVGSSSAQIRVNQALMCRIRPLRSYLPQG